MMELTTLELKTDERGVATVALNRPERHNAFNEVVIRELADVFTALGTDNTVRAIILCGNGKSFSAGADLEWMKAAAQYNEAENQADAQALSDMLRTIRNTPKPVIALAKGAVMGGGTGLVSCADIVIAAKDTKFAVSEVKLGLIPATISPYVIAAIGERQARRYFVTGEIFRGDVAQSIGLVHQLVDTADELEAAANALLDNAILKNGPEAMAATKVLISDIAGRPVTDDLRKNTATRIAKIRSGEEAIEGVTAFLEKRAPKWQS